MKHSPFPEFFKHAACMLGEGAVIERLRRNGTPALDSHIVNSAFIYAEPGRAALAAIFGQYMDIGCRYDLPLVLSTPTWRASEQRIAAAGYAGKDVNGDNFRFLDDLRRGYGDYARQVAICGLLSCRGDAYNPAEALSAAEAFSFHAWQADKLARAGVDILLAATLPALSEAIGMAMAMAATGSPYIISFVLRAQGTLLDGTPLKQAVGAIDGTVHPEPLAFMANCTHASIFKSALLDPVHSSARVRQRMAGLFANTAALPPEALDNSNALVEEDPRIFGRTVAALHNELGMKILGGCCGTDGRHIDCLAEWLRMTG